MRMNMKIEKHISTNVLGEEASKLPLSFLGNIIKGRFIHHFFPCMNEISSLLFCLLKYDLNYATSVSLT